MYCDSLYVCAESGSRDGLVPSLSSRNGPLLLYSCWRMIGKWHVHDCSSTYWTCWGELLPCFVSPEHVLFTASWNGLLGTNPLRQTFCNEKIETRGERSHWANFMACCPLAKIEWRKITLAAKSFPCALSICSPATLRAAVHSITNTCSDLSSCAEVMLD